jgi:TatD DNase family protein
MIDVHCHLNFPQFQEDLEEVIRRAKVTGVEKIINVGTSINSSREAITLSKTYEDFYAIVGVHPSEAGKLSGDWLIELGQLAKDKKVVGIGEIGLDYFHKPVDEKAQKDIFTKQIELAIKLKLPLQIHSRQAAKDIIDIVKGYRHDLGEIPGMFHCMSGDLDYLRKALDLGFYVGFDGNITYEGFAPGENTLLEDLIKYAPIDRVLLETDAPFLAPIPHRGSRNEPSYVIIIGEFISKIKQTPFKEIEKITTGNTHKIFKI